MKRNDSKASAVGVLRKKEVTVNPVKRGSSRSISADRIGFDCPTEQ